MPVNPGFHIIESPDLRIIDAVAASRPYSPFAGRRYVAAMCASGLKPLAFIEDRESASSIGCMGFISGGLGFAKLTIPSMPNFSTQGNCWTVIREFANKNSIADIEANSFASINPLIPEANAGVTISMRHEHVITLLDRTLDAMLSSNHKRNLNKANKRGLELRQPDGEQSLDSHCELAIGSLARHSARGNGASTTINRALLQELVRSGCATIWQAWTTESCHSSVVLLCDQSTAYYYSAGTSTDGLESRASVWLVAAIARRLFEDGVQTFNLGGTSPGESGLRKFKSGFGAKEIQLANSSIKLKTGADRLISRARAKVRKLLNPENSDN